MLPPFFLSLSCVPRKGNLLAPNSSYIRKQRFPIILPTVDKTQNSAAKPAPKVSVRMLACIRGERCTAQYIRTWVTAVMTLGFCQHHLRGSVRFACLAVGWLDGLVGWLRAKGKSPQVAIPSHHIACYDSPGLKKCRLRRFGCMEKKKSRKISIYSQSVCWLEVKTSSNSKTWFGGLTLAQIAWEMTSRKSAVKQEGKIIHGPPLRIRQHLMRSSYWCLQLARLKWPHGSRGCHRDLCLSFNAFARGSIFELAFQNNNNY